jgi:hypothetical protein
MVFDSELYQAASRLLAEQGEDASWHAIDRARALAEIDDIDGTVLWIGIAQAVRELQRDRRPGEAVH